VNVGYAVSGPSSSGVGGLIGLVQSLNTISKSYNSGFVSGYSQIDCLIGDGNSMLISDSFNKAPVSAGNTNLGGLVGRSQTITITNSLNLGSVSGQVTGGLVGRGHTTTITSSFNVGYVNGTDVGGLIGIATNSVTLSYSFNGGILSDRASSSSSIGGFVAIAQQSLFVYNSVNFGDIVANSNQVTCELIT